MDREYILNLPAGKEIDSLIAKKIMGWSNNYNGVDTVFWFDKKIIFYKHSIDSWHPSTDILAAWEIAEKLRLFILPFGKTDWCATKTRNYRGAFENLVVADTAPLAICRAALLTVLNLE